MNNLIITVGMTITIVFAIFSIVTEILEMDILTMVYMVISINGAIIVAIGSCLNSTKKNKKEKKQC